MRQRQSTCSPELLRIRQHRTLRNALRIFTAVVLMSTGASAAFLEFNILNEYAYAPPLGGVLFNGTITNLSPITLQTSDLFFSVSGYDPTALVTWQELGQEDVEIPSGMTTPVMPLFSVALSELAIAGQSYAIDEVILQDLFGNISAGRSVTVTAMIPEPSFRWALVGAILLLLKHRKAS